MAHTPTPWKMTHNKRIGQFTIHGTHWCEKGQSNKIGAPLISLDDEKDKANAEFIVRACNAYDELVSLLALVERRIADDLPMPSPDSGLHKRMAAVLAQARVEL